MKVKRTVRELNRELIIRDSRTVFPDFGSLRELAPKDGYPQF